MTTPLTFSVDLPAGGQLTLKNADEVDMWQSNASKYINDYGLAKQNDLVLLGAILIQGIHMYRAQQNLALGGTKLAENQNAIVKAAEQIQQLEKSLGIDKKSREAGGQHTVANYVERLKRAAHEKGVHLADRTKAYEKFAMEMRWKIRLLRHGDPEDRQHHGISEDAIVTWAEEELGKLEAADKKWAREKGAVFTGKL